MEISNHIQIYNIGKENFSFTGIRRHHAQANGC